MKIFEIYYNGAITIEAENEEDAVTQFNNKYWDYGDIDAVELIEDEEEED